MSTGSPWLWRKLRGDERRGIRFVLVVSAAFLLACWAFIVAWLDSGQRQALRHAEADLLRRFAVVQGQTGELLHQSETVLWTARRWIQLHPGRDPRRDPEFSELLQALRGALAGSVHIQLLDDRQQRWPLGESSDALPALAALDGVSVDTAAPAVLTASGIRLAGTVLMEGRLFLPMYLSLRAEGGEGRQPHGLLLWLELDRLQRAFAGSRYPQSGAVALWSLPVALHPAGLSARGPAQPLLHSVGVTAPVWPASFWSGGQLPGTEPALWLTQAGGEGLDAGEAEGGGRYHLVAARLPGHSFADALLLQIGASEAELLAPWHEQCVMVMLAALALTLLTLTLAAYLVRMLDQQAEDREELWRMATCDALTGLLNRRIFLTRLEEEFERSRRYGAPLALLMIDCDHFKQVNDGYGHAVGDLALQALAQAGRTALRGCDLFARMGGEEFAVLLPETPLEQALGVAERLREMVAAQGVDTFAGPLHITVSIGVAALDGGDMSAETLLLRADQALYGAKSAGRNRVALPASNDPSADRPPLWRAGLVARS